ncbi:unnamed protein product [Orchesella dallaii]|uniref:ATPase AAA-type core domain-containing protein n=1 Tax=Orchesella dallaii TaxID=48710 RepID=A0ABP1RKB4_9HEXA
MPGDVNPHPSFGDIIRAVKDVCILPMGSIDIHRVAPFLTKSVLIVGPPGSGKKTLVNMVCTELNATLVDLTAANIVGKYPGKPGLKMLMHLIQKVGKAVEPVIFLIDNCERTYMKKVPKTNHDEPKRLKKQLGKFLKTFTPEDLFLLIGLSSEPWVAPFKTLKKDYQRIFYVPPADYGTRLLLWKEGLATISELLHPDINYTLLAKLSQGWTSGSINKTCRDVVEDHHKDLAERNKETSKETDPWRHLGRAAPVRFIKIGKVYITMSKLMQYISEYDPVFIEQEKLWNSWWNKTPLQKARLGTQVKVGPEKKKGKKGKKKSK